MSAWAAGASRAESSSAPEPPEAMQTAGWIAHWLAGSLGREASGGASSVWTCAPTGAGEPFRCCAASRRVEDASEKVGGLRSFGVIRRSGTGFLVRAAHEGSRPAPLLSPPPESWVVGGGRMRCPSWAKSGILPSERLALSDVKPRKQFKRSWHWTAGARARIHRSDPSVVKRRRCFGIEISLRMALFADRDSGAAIHGAQRTDPHWTGLRSDSFRPLAVRRAFRRRPAFGKPRRCRGARTEPAMQAESAMPVTA